MVVGMAVLATSFAINGSTLLASNLDFSERIYIVVKDGYINNSYNDNDIIKNEEHFMVPLLLFTTV